MGWKVLCDFDGTVSMRDTMDTLLERYGLPAWRAIEEDWKRGRVGSRTCMQRQVRLLQLDRATLDQHLDQQEVDPDFVAFVAWTRARRLPVTIVSDGLDYAIERILANNGVTGLPVVANRLRLTARGWRLSSPHQATSCLSGTCKCACAARARTEPHSRVLLIGDGRSDFCVASSADFVLAKGALIDHCRSHGIPHAPICGFGDVISLLPWVLGQAHAQKPSCAAMGAVEPVTHHLSSR